MISAATVARIGKLTQVDLDHKDIFKLFLSAVEELGEFATELKVEEHVFGNDHKKPGKDGSKGEAVDMIVMGICLYMARKGAIADLDAWINAKVDKWLAGQQLSLQKKVEGS